MTRTYNYKYQNPFNLDDLDKQKDSIHSLPFWIGLLVVLSLCLTFGIVFVIDGILPTALTINDEANYPDAFIAERAARDLKYLTDLGPRVTGSYENEYATVEYLSIQINSIIREAHAIQFIEFDVQEVSGGYYLNDALGFMNIYDKVQNLVVKVHGHNNQSEHSILLNVHFDTVPVSPGGSDDGINVVSILEILRKLSKSDSRLMQNVIFLFNGAEETPLQAAHGYVAHHKWAKESKFIINLEACGAGGKSLLFQTGPEAPWLVRYYNKVPHPYGNVMGEEIFQVGLIPSDTDFRLFRDFGNMVGVDVSFVKDGYRYHTKFDRFGNIELGSYQHVGDNILSLVRSLGNAPEVLEKERSTGKAVYFDILGFFMISYSNNMATIINLATVILSVGVFLLSLFIFRINFSESTIKYLALTTLAILIGWLLAAVFVFILAVILDVLNKTMSWYANPWTIIGLYAVPIIGFSGCLMYFTSYTYIYFQNLSLNVRGQIQAHIVRSIWTFVLSIGIIFNVRSIFIVMIPVLFNSLGFLIIHILRLHHTIGIWLIVYVATLFAPTLYLLYHMLLSYICFIPMIGRMGSQLNPEFFVVGITLMMTILITSPLTALANFLRRAKYYYLTLLAVFSLFIGLLYTPLVFPYSGNPDSPKPQRHWILHTQREFYEFGKITKTDAGFLMANMDRNSPEILKPYIKEMANVKSLENDCGNYTLCALPLTHAKVAKKMRYSTWIPTSNPIFPVNEALKFSVVSKEQLSPTFVKYNIKVSGPDKIVFYLTPKANAKLVNTSLVDTITPSKTTFQDRPVYIILYQLGKGNGTSLTFDITMSKPQTFQGPILDLALSARYVHEKRIQKTGSFLGFLNQFPEWTHVIPWLSMYQSHVI